MEKTSCCSCCACSNSGSCSNYMNCPANGYIVERVLSSRCEMLCYKDTIQFLDLPCGLCPPFCLQGVEVICICVDPCNAQCLQMTLRCILTDRRGCRAESTVKISVQTESQRTLCGVNVRYGADVSVQSACFCAPNAFHVCFRIRLNTIFSRCEIIGGKCASPCPELPLYPPPICCPQDNSCSEHFCC